MDPQSASDRGLTDEELEYEFTVSRFGEKLLKKESSKKILCILQEAIAKVSFPNQVAGLLPVGIPSLKRAKQRPELPPGSFWRNRIDDDNIIAFVHRLVIEEQHGNRFQVCNVDISAVCTLVERELRRIYEPAREIAQELIKAHLRIKRRYPTSGLELWERNGEATLGIFGMVICGLRRGLIQENKTIISFVKKYFDPPFAPLLVSPDMIHALDKLRLDYRNPAAHGLQNLSFSDYNACCLLAFGRPKLSKWIILKRRGKIKPEIGILHNHLALKKLQVH